MWRVVEGCQSEVFGMKDIENFKQVGKWVVKIKNSVSPDNFHLNDSSARVGVSVVS